MLTTSRSSGCRDPRREAKRFRPRREAKRFSPLLLPLAEGRAASGAVGQRGMQLVTVVMGWCAEHGECGRQRGEGCDKGGQQRRLHCGQGNEEHQGSPLREQPCARLRDSVNGQQVVSWHHVQIRCGCPSNSTVKQLRSLLPILWRDDVWQESTSMWRFQTERQLLPKRCIYECD